MNQILNLIGRNKELFNQDISWKKEQIVKLFFKMIPDFGHKETRKYLDGKI